MEKKIKLRKRKEEMMKKFDVILRADYEKQFFVYAESEKEAREKVEILLFDTNALTFGNENFMGGEAEITEKEKENEMDFYGEPPFDEIPFSGSNRHKHKSVRV